MTKFLSVFCLLFAVLYFAQAPIAVKVTDASGNENFNVTCVNNLDANGCFTLGVEYPVIKQTTSYETSSENFFPLIPFNQGTPINANYDDLFAVKLNLPFKFCFFNQYFESVVVGSNGMITFDESQLGNINYPNVAWQNPSTSLPKNSIFGAYHDMVFSSSDASEIYYSVTGSYPNRKFIINFFEGRIAGCTERSSSQIVLHETTNIVDIFIGAKPQPCATRKFENALIGIINNDGSLGYSPAARNTGNWQTSQEAWRFSPSGANIQPQINWLDSSGQIVATGITATLCPTQNEVYTANVNFNICGNSILTLTDDFNLSFDPSYPSSKNYSQDFCGNSPITLNLNDFRPNLTFQNPSNFVFTFYNTIQDAQNNTNSISTNYTLNSSSVLYVRIQNPSIPDCYRIAVLTLNFKTYNLITDIISVCDTNNDGIEANYDLNLINNEIFPVGTTGFSYFLSQNDAQNNTGAVTSVNISSGTKIWVRVQSLGCTYILGPVNFVLKTGVNVNSPVSFVLTMCDINADNFEEFDFAVNLGPLISNQPGASFTAYETAAAAFQGGGTPLGSIKKGIYTIFIRVQIPGGCFAVVPVNMNITFTEILANDKNEYICFNGSEDITVNLVTLSSNMLTQPLTVPVTEFYNNYLDAMEGLTPISQNQVITDNGNLVTKTFFVRFEQDDDCYTIRALNVNLVHPVIVQSDFTICDFNNDNSENVPLNQFSGQIIGNQNATVTFFLTQANAQNNTNPISAINLSGNQQIFVRINSYNCIQVYPITVSLTPTPNVNPNVTISLTNICDNNNDGVEVYNLLQAQTQIYTGSGVTFTYYTSYNAATQTFSGQISDPSQFPVPGNATVFVKTKFNGSECFSVTQLTVQMTFLPAIVLNNAVLNQCDEDFNLNETFQLNDALSQLFLTSQNSQPLSDMDISFYLNSADANSGNSSSQIGNTITTSISTVQIWARFQSKTTGCYSVAPIQLNTYFPPKAINSTVIICDDNLDGIFEVNLNNFTQLYVDIPNSINTFSYYLTQQDALNGTNPIANPQNFSAQPFPQQIWVKVTNIPGCDDVASINFTPGTKITLQNSGPFLINNICDNGNDGIENVNLTQFENQIFNGGNAVFTYYLSLSDLNSGINAVSNPSNFTFNQNTMPDTVFVKVSVPGFCPDIASINIILKSVPSFVIPTQFFCPEQSFSFTLNVEGHTIISYTWINPAGEVVSTGNTLSNAVLQGIYSVTVVSDNGCSFTATFEAKYYDVPVIQQLTANGNTFTVIATGSQPILYSIDGFNWQDSNIFYNLPTGITTFYVKYAEGKCIVKKDGVILDIKNTITPNGDGFNDKWIVKNLQVFGKEMTNVKVFDRYSYLIFEQNTNTEIVWDGTIAGRPIPTSSYWYVITLPDGRTFTGWILVKNNN